jgi:hypothetical protein
MSCGGRRWAPCSRFRARPRTTSSSVHRVGCCHHWTTAPRPRRIGGVARCWMRWHALVVSRAFPSWNRSILTGIDLCHACSDYKIEDANARAGVGARGQSAVPPRNQPRTSSGVLIDGRPLPGHTQRRPRDDSSATMPPSRRAAAAITSNVEWSPALGQRVWVHAEVPPPLS